MCVCVWGGVGGGGARERGRLDMHGGGGHIVVCVCVWKSVGTFCFHGTIQGRHAWGCFTESALFSRVPFTT